MSDSVESLEAKPSEPTSIIVRIGKQGTLVERQKGPDGKFLPKEKKLATKKDIQLVVRNFLNNKFEKGSDGKMVKKSQTHLEKIMESMAKLAQNENPEVASASVKAAEFLMVYAYGKPSMSDKDREALETAGVKYVVGLVSAEDLMHPEVLPEKPKPVLRPSFADKPQIIDPEYIVENT